MTLTSKFEVKVMDLEIFHTQDFEVFKFFKICIFRMLGWILLILGLMLNTVTKFCSVEAYILYKSSKRERQYKKKVYLSG